MKMKGHPVLPPFSNVIFLCQGLRPCLPVQGKPLTRRFPHHQNKRWSSLSSTQMCIFFCSCIGDSLGRSGSASLRFTKAPHSLSCSSNGSAEFHILSAACLLSIEQILRMCMPYASFSTSPWSRCLSRLDACPQGRKAHEGWHAGGCSCFPSGIDSRCSWRVPFVAVTSCLESNNCHENTRHPDTSSCAWTPCEAGQPLHVASCA